MNSKKIIVSISLNGEDIRIGKLWLHLRKGRESASFEYDKQWMEHSERFALEPALQLTEGTFHTKDGLSVFGAIGDSAPDRWGRVLMRRAEAAKAETESKIPTTLFEADYLLGVNDEARQGALRFSIAPHETDFLAPKDKTAIPPLVDLPRLLSATEHFIEDNENAEDLRILLAPGSSLGGARPKASIRDHDGSLAIAKFSRKDDEFNTVMWEAVALTLAERAGIAIPSWRLETILEKPVLILKRFDRNNQQRTPFLSAMSMLGAQDNEQHSYLEMAYALTHHGAHPDEDLTELWRRMVFTILISNTDDHLRNHGFLYEHLKGWRLSPAYDMNPTPIEIKPRILSTAINLDDTSASLETALSVADEFRLSIDQAHKITKEVVKATAQWRQVASTLGISKRESDRMTSAFEHDDYVLAKNL